MKQWGKIEAAESDYRTGREVGLREYGDKFYKYMEKNPDVKEKLLEK